MAGEEARRVGELPVSRGSVSDQPVSDGLRCAEGDHAEPIYKGVLETATTGGRGRRGPGGCGFARPAGGEGGGGDHGGVDPRVAGQARYDSAGNDGERGGGGPGAPGPSSRRPGARGENPRDASSRSSAPRKRDSCRYRIRGDTCIPDPPGPER